MAAAAAAASQSILRGVKRVHLRFDIMHPRAQTCRELYRRMTSKKLQMENPECEVKASLVTGAAPLVQIEYRHGAVDEFDAVKNKIDAILQNIEEATQTQENWNSTVKFKQRLIDGGFLKA